MYREIYEALRRQGAVKTAVILNGIHMGSKCILDKGVCVLMSGAADWSIYEEQIGGVRSSQVIDIDGTKIFVEVYMKNPHLVILGGGHVSRPVAHMGKMLGFHVTVMDDREEFLKKEHFPDADERIWGSFEQLDEKIPPYENAYYVIVTRGHAGDSMCARHILKRPYTYLGMIGSRTKVKLTREKLLKEGYTETQLDTIHAPIGLPIGGQTPEEIAVSIMAEIVQEKNKITSAFIDERVEESVSKGLHGVMVTIVKKSGSSPRGVGTKMFVDSEGNSCGTIGGGRVEYEAIKHAADVKETEVITYNLSVSDQKNLGMICGGNVDVLFEKV